jgi:hypothetical protein
MEAQKLQVYIISQQSLFRHVSSIPFGIPASVAGTGEITTAF